MRYYDLHERIYQRIAAQSLNTWDAFTEPDADFDHFCLRPFLEAELSGCIPATASTALDVGCGTGPVACFLAARGFRVDGIDVSLTAIEMAQRMAVSRGHSISYQVADICAGVLPDRTFDLIVDSHCLHCLVLPDDRARALRNLMSMLAPGGSFLCETMVAHPEMEFGSGSVLDPDGSLWRGVSNAADSTDAVYRDGRWSIPTRLIAPAESVLQELTSAGFAIRHSEVLIQKPGEPAQLSAHLHAAST
jgi:SAM-dependent methyltransferase